MSLKNGDLAGTVHEEVSIDEFEPKAGKEEDVIVVAFYLEDEEPAKDLNTFIQRGFIDTLDVEVSPNTDEEGRYLVFAEMSRDETFPEKFLALLKDVENLTGDIEWKIRTYYSGEQEFTKDDPMLFSFMVTDPEEYVPKDKFDMKKVKEGVEDFFSNSLITGLTFDGNVITITGNNRKIVAEVVDVGDYDTVIGRNNLGETAYKVGQNLFEGKVLQNIVGDCQVIQLGKFLVVSRDDEVLLLKNTEINH